MGDEQPTAQQPASQDETTEPTDAAAQEPQAQPGPDDGDGGAAKPSSVYSG